MIIFILIKGNIKLILCLNILVLIKLWMAYSETKVIMGGLTHVPILIFLVNFIKGKFEAITGKVNVIAVKETKPKVKIVAIKDEEVKAEEVKESEVKKEAN